MSYTVQDAPTLAPAATHNNTADCAADDLSLTAGGAAPAGSSYVWTGPNGFSATTANPIVAEANARANGTYQVTVTTPAGCTTTSSVSVTGIEDALAEPTIVSTGPACVGDRVQLSIPAFSGSSVSYAWSIPAAALAAGDITGAATNVLTVDPLVAAHAGNYSVTVTVDGCTTTSDPYDVAAFAAPTLAPSATAGTICTGDDLALAAGGAGATGWSWRGPAGFASSAQNPTLSGVTLSQNGTYTVTATSVNGCTTSASITVSNIEPVPTTPAVTSNSPVCEDSDIVLSSATSYGGTVVYQWINGNGTNIPNTVAQPYGGNTAIATIPASDTIAVPPYRLNVSVDGCAAPVSAPLDPQVDRVPVATASNNGPVCAGDDATLQAGTVPGARYEWRTGGTLVSTDQTFSVSGITATTTYQLTVVRGQCTSAHRHLDRDGDAEPGRIAALYLHRRERLLPQ